MNSVYRVGAILLLGLIFPQPTWTNNYDEELNLDEVSDAAAFAYGSFGGPHPPLTGYGMGGYGDPPSQNFNLRVCGQGERDGANCTANNPDANYQEWRFVPNVGWAKFSRYGASRMDWWNYKKTIRWPFGRYQTFGYNWF